MSAQLSLADPAVSAASCDCNACYTSFNRWNDDGDDDEDYDYDIRY